MFKAAPLICRKPDGSLASAVDCSLDPLLEIAKAARVSGLLDGVSVVEGVVLANWRRDPAYVFKVDSAVQSLAMDTKKRKVK